MNKRKVIAIVASVITGITILIIGGVFWFYEAFKDNANSQIAAKEAQAGTTYTSDADKPKVGESRPEREAKLELTQDQVDLEIGAIYNPMDYIKLAEDQYGYSVKDKVTIDKAIPTDVPGEYEVEYIMIIGEQQTSRILKVSVKEMK